jgi:hypothetical protein
VGFHAQTFVDQSLGETVGIDRCSCNHSSGGLFCVTFSGSPDRPSPRVGTILDVSSVEHHDEEGHLHLFAVDDPRLWEFRSRLSDQDFAIPDVSDEDWDSFHAIIAEA